MATGKTVIESLDTGAELHYVKILKASTTGGYKQFIFSLHPETHNHL